MTAENKRLNRLHNDPEHLKEMIERQKEDIGAVTEDTQKRMKTQREVKKILHEF